MKINQEQLDLIEEYASNFLSFEEISIFLDIDYDIFLKLVKNKKNSVYEAYFRGKTKTKLEIRRNIVKMAKHGSPQAEQFVEKFIVEQEISERDASG